MQTILVYTDDTDEMKSKCVFDVGAAGWDLGHSEAAGGIGRYGALLCRANALHVGRDANARARDKFQGGLQTVDRCSV